MSTRPSPVAPPPPLVLACSPSGRPNRPCGFRGRTCNRQTWPRHFRPIPAKFAEIVAHISRREKVRINLALSLQKRAQSLINKAKAELANVEIFDHPTNDAWCRDHGPILREAQPITGEVALTDWRYNAWGGKYPPYALDNEIPSRIGAAPGLAAFREQDGARRRVHRRQRRWPAAHDRGVPAQQKPQSAAHAGAHLAEPPRLSRRAHDPVARRRDRAG